MKRLAAFLALSLATTSIAAAQTAFGSPTAPVPAGLAGVPRGISRTAPSEGGPETYGLGDPRLGTPTPGEIREERRLDGYAHICNGC